MCGRYGLTATAEEYVELFGAFPEKEGSKWQSWGEHYDIRPTQTVPIVTNETGTPQITFSRWGFSPSWAKNTLINTRWEGAFTSKLWRKPTLEKRCLVPASYFYEWQKVENKTQPWMIELLKKNLFSMAGVFSLENDGKNSYRKVFSILTIEANEKLRTIHNSGKNPHRQPVILDSQYYKDWLDPTLIDQENIQKLVHRIESNDIKVTPLKKIGNDITHEKPF